MNENININEEQDNISFADSLRYDLTEGLHSVLYKRVGNISINEPNIKNAFEKFVKLVECDSTISVAEILYASEASIAKNKVSENAGNKIYCYNEKDISNKGFLLKLRQYSVQGVYNLFSLRNGITLNLSSFGGDLSAGEIKRFLVISERKAIKFVKTAKKFGVDLIQCGEMLANNRIILTRGTEVLTYIDKTVIDADSEKQTITLDARHLSAFVSGYNSVCSYGLCNCVTNNNIIRFGIDNTLDNVFAKALGYFAGCMFLKAASVKTVFSNGNKDVVAIPRPCTADGDYLFLLKLRTENNMPEKGHYGQLFYYLSEKKAAGIIKDVLPLRENINSLINHLSGPSLEYVSLAEIPTDCFGVIVSVPRGESVNGVKLGYFKYI